jgi:hypothetical protein
VATHRHCSLGFAVGTGSFLIAALGMHRCHSEVAMPSSSWWA